MALLQLKDLDDMEANAREKELRSRLSRLAIKKRSLLRPIRVSAKLPVWVRHQGPASFRVHPCVRAQCALPLLSPYAALQNDAAKRFQYAWRCFVLRKHLKALIKSVWQRRFDTTYGTYYFVNTATGATSWEMPLALKYIPLPVSTDSSAPAAALLDA
jgi:hypothetical protein